MIASEKKVMYTLDHPRVFLKYTVTVPKTALSAASTSADEALTMPTVNIDIIMVRANTRDKALFVNFLLMKFLLHKIHNEYLSAAP